MTQETLLTNFIDEYKAFPTEQRDNGDPDVNEVAVRDRLLELISNHVLSLNYEETLKQKQMDVAALEMDVRLRELQKDLNKSSTIFTPDFGGGTTGGTVN